jgi:hypothetical protein
MWHKAIEGKQEEHAKDYAHCGWHPIEVAEVLRQLYGRHYE